MLDPCLGTEKYKTINNPNARSVVLSLLYNMDYMDAWKILNEDKILHTERKQGRLDYFLISHFMFFYLHECEIIPGYRSDHS